MTPTIAEYASYLLATTSAGSPFYNPLMIEGTPPPDMKTYILEGSRMRMEADFHGEAQRVLGFFKGYGWNTNALEDVLRDDGLTEAKHPYRVIWKDARPSDPNWVSHFGEIVELMSNTDGIELVIEEADPNSPSGMFKFDDKE